MTWESKVPEFGDIIRTRFSNFYHYGIYVNDNRVIQFGLNPSLRVYASETDVKVCVSDVNTFLCGEQLEVCCPDIDEAKKFFDKQDIVKNAEKRIGETGYNILYNNCEHFVHECSTGSKFCMQTDSVRNLFKNLNIVDVYFTVIPDEIVGEIYPDSRRQLVENTTNVELKKQRFYVWKLLEYALDRSLGIKIKNIDMFKNKNGKWFCNECFFSLSHTKGLVAVAISKKPVGIDIEIFERKVHEKLHEKVFTSSEFEKYNSLSEQDKEQFFVKTWCSKESIFKKSDEEHFRPNSLETDKEVVVDFIEMNGLVYCYAVASQDVNKVRIYKQVKL
jgi:phosphopantetheine--protein transferase-like protein